MARLHGLVSQSVQPETDACRKLGDGRMGTQRSPCLSQGYGIGIAGSKTSVKLAQQLDREIGRQVAVTHCDGRGTAVERGSAQARSSVLADAHRTLVTPARRQDDQGRELLFL